MSRWWDDIAMVVELACETSWRTDSEQRALLQVAYKTDRERSKETTTNPPERRVAPYLERHVDETRRVDPDQHVITTPSEAKAKKRVSA